MRYHWGLGVGHYHAHHCAARPADNSEDALENLQPQDDDTAEQGSVDGGDGSDGSDSDNEELGLDDRQQEGWEDVESEDSELENHDQNGVEDELEDHTGM